MIYTKIPLSFLIFSYFAGANTMGRLMRFNFCLYLVVTVLLFPSFCIGALPGSGTAAAPYRIESFEHFEEFASTDSYWAVGVHTRLEADIDLDPALPGRVTYDTAVIAPDTDLNGSFQGIPFSAVLDGNGYVIRNLQIEEFSVNGNDYLGLFGKIDQNSQIHRLGLVSITIRASHKSNYVGAICGTNGEFGELGGIITETYAVGTIEIDGNTLSGSYYGGLCGSNFGSISNSYAVMNITGGKETNSVGGLCGINRGDISNSYSTGSVTAGFRIGGLCGNNSGTVQNCYSTGALVGTSTINERRLGGLCSTGSGGLAINSYWNVSTSGVSVSGGGYPKSTANMMTESTFAGWHDGSWVIDEGNDYPRLTWQGTTGTVMDYQYPKTYSGDGAATPFELSNANDLISMSMRPADWGGQFVMVQDIDMAGEASYRPIEYFTGILDGAGHEIQNLTVNGGMFVQVAQGSEIKNVGLEGISVHGSETNTGALCDYNNGAIINCFVSGTVQGGNTTGGVCGTNAGTISSCFSSCSVSGGNSSGGFCGSNGGDVKNCYSTGAVVGATNTGGFCGSNGGDVEKCYSTGTVDGGTNVGGFCGRIWGTIDDSFWDLNSSGQTDSSGGIAKTTLEMHNISTYLDAGWDFSMIWLDPNPNSNDGYPSLQQRVYPYDIAVQAIITHMNPIMSPSSSPVLPGSDTNMPAVGEPFYLEVWAIDVCDPSTGLTGVYVDVNYNDLVEVLSINHSSPFTFQATGAIDGSSVINFGGSALPHGGGICPGWVRIGWLESQISEEVSTVTYDLLPGATGVAAFGRGLVEWYLVDLGSVSLYRDCNGNGTSDADDITSGTSQDCNGNGIPDECDIASGFSLDCNDNEIPDECDISVGISLDCNGNGIPDECDITSVFSLDCNGNGIPDECDIASGTSTDENGDDIPDDCQAKIEMTAVAVAEPPYYTSETRTELPESIGAVGRSSKYYVELWGQCVGDNTNGLRTISVDVLHDSFCSVLNMGFHSSLEQAHGVIVSDGVDEFGGQFTLAGEGIAPQWVRLGWLEMRANLETDSAVISLEPGDEEITEHLITTVSKSYFGAPAGPGGLIQADPSAATIIEGDIGSIDVWLSEMPGDPNIPVEVEASLDGDPNIVVEGNSQLVFDKTNWWQPQQIILYAGHDLDSADANSVLTLTGRQDGEVVDTSIVSVQVNDDDPSLEEMQILTDLSSVTMSEGDIVSIGAWLSHMPFDPNIPFEVEASLDGDPNIVVEGNSQLVFDKTNWWQSQYIELAANHDSDSWNDSAVLTLTGIQDGVLFDTRIIPVEVLDDDFRVILWEHVNLQGLQLEILAPLRSYDLDNDNTIGLGDLSFFAGSWLQAIPPGDEMHDFDFDGFVGTGDLSWFVTGWNKDVDDMSIVYPPYDAQAQTSSSLPKSIIKSMDSKRAVIKELRDLNAGQSEYSEMTDVVVAATITEMPSISDTCTTLPDTVESVLTGNSYILEFWVSDVGQVNSGITSVCVNAEFASSVFDIQNVTHGNTFTLFAQHASSEGRLENLGGSTVDSGVAMEPTWVRFGVVEMRALSDEDVFSIELLPSELPVSSYGRGNVPWDFIHFVPVHSHMEGDIDESGRVDMNDFGIMAYSWNTGIGNLLWNAKCDLNKNARVDIGDIKRLSEQWMKTE